MAEAFPLAWPDGWPRTAPNEQKRGDMTFKRPRDTGRGYTRNMPWTFAEARDALMEEVGRHGARTCVLSTNFQLGKNFLAVEGKRRPADEGVAIYFQRRGKPYVMACDRYVDAEGNMRSLTLALEALRTLERHGGGVMLERAYEGFTALPAPKRWWEVLGVSPEASPDEINRAFRARAAEAHPDRGGSHAAMAELSAARAAGLKRTSEDTSA